MFYHPHYSLSIPKTGFSTDFEHLDGHKFTVDVNDVTECDHVMRVAGKGMPRRGGREGYGDLYITFDVDFPEALHPKQKEEIRRILTTNQLDWLNQTGAIVAATSVT